MKIPVLRILHSRRRQQSENKWEETHDMPDGQSRKMVCVWMYMCVWTCVLSSVEQLGMTPANRHHVAKKWKRQGLCEEEQSRQRANKNQALGVGVNAACYLCVCVCVCITYMHVCAHVSSPISEHVEARDWLQQSSSVVLQVKCWHMSFYH